MDDYELNGPPACPTISISAFDCVRLLDADDIDNSTWWMKVPAILLPFPFFSSILMYCKYFAAFMADSLLQYSLSVKFV